MAYKCYNSVISYFICIQILLEREDLVKDQLLVLLIIVLIYAFYVKVIKPPEQTKPPTAQEIVEQRKQQLKEDNLKKLDILANDALKAFIRQDGLEMTKNYKQMTEIGVTSYTMPKVLKRTTPDSPPIEVNINGKVISGDTCTISRYVYDSKTHEAGYCF